MPSELPLRERIKAEKARRSLHEFVQQAWHVVEPSTPFVDGWHVQAICDHLQHVTTGEIRQLLVNMPPRHCKSLLISTFWPMWVWITYPNTRWLCASYALSLAVRDNRKCRILIESDWFKERWGDVFYLSKDQNAKMRFENNRKGYRLCVSSESAATGEGGDALIIDDAISARDANSDIARENCQLWFTSTMSTRLNDPKKGAKVVVMQRLHKKDLSGFLLEQGGWTHLNLPAEFVPEKKCYTSIGWCDPRKEPGELLWPAQVPHKELDQLKRALGPQAYSAQFQQDPVSTDGNVFKQQWFQYFSIADDFYVIHKKSGEEKKILRSSCWLFATIDLAASKSSTADYTVIATWAVTRDNELLLLDMIRERLDGPEIEQTIRQCYLRWHHSYIVVETVGMQLVFLQKMAKEGIPCKPFKPVKDKVSRAISASTFYANEQVYHLQFAHYLTFLEPEMIEFPKAEHDDVVDVISMATETALNPDQPNIRTFESDATDYKIYRPNQLVVSAAVEQRSRSAWGDW